MDWLAKNKKTLGGLILCLIGAAWNLDQLVHPDEVARWLPTVQYESIGSVISMLTGAALVVRFGVK